MDLEKELVVTGAGDEGGENGGEEAQLGSLGWTCTHCCI